mgnify:CR=1 FL=1
MLILDSLLVGGLKFVLSRIAEAVEAEMYDESALREELLAAQMKLELGEISEEDFAQIEEQILASMRAIRERREAASGRAVEQQGTSGTGRITVERIEAAFDDEERR